ncbi:MAG: MBL fold metallo-hydrolase RNA specificity domain-containing protein [Leptospirales bacterium]
MKLSFQGAASCVTGSCHLLDVGGFRILVDCGMFQGPDEIFSSNLKPFSFDPESISAVLLTHAHLDHCGRLPFLVRQGFRGPVIATAPTRYLAEIVLWDAAHLQEEHVAHGNGKKGHRPRMPLGSRGKKAKGGTFFSVADVMDLMALFAPPAEYEIPVNVAPGIDVTFHNAGHILGSASVQITVTRPGKKTRILFSGDLGPASHPLLSPASPPQDSDYVVMETTYGDRLHRSFDSSKDELLGVLADTYRRGGQVLIPTFAIERAQDLLYFFREWREEGRLPGKETFFLDSPMAINVTHIYERFPDLLADSLKSLFQKGKDPFMFPELRLTRSVLESRSISETSARSVILAGSGMVSGGRILYHLGREIENPRSSLVFVGFQAQGTLGRSILDGEKTVRLLGEEKNVRIGTHSINGFSAHADQGDLLAWCQSMKQPDGVFLIHGEPRSLGAFREKLGTIGWDNIQVPALHETVEVPERSSRRDDRPLHSGPSR